MLLRRTLPPSSFGVCNVSRYIINSQSQIEYGTICNTRLSLLTFNMVLIFRKPHSYNDSYSSLLRELLPLMYKGNDTIGSDAEEDWNQWVLKENFVPGTSPANESDVESKKSCFPSLAWDWTFQTCEPNSSDVANIEFLKTVNELDKVIQLTIGIIGITSNLIAIPILCNKSMKSVFNKLLICLLILHTIYIFCSVLTENLWPEWEKDDQSQIFSDSFIILFPFILHPLKQFMLFSSIFITVLMARQRYLAIRHPVEYRNYIQSTNPWKAALKCLVAVLITAALLTFPLYFETTIQDVEKGPPQIIDINSTHFQYVSTSL